MSDIRTELLRYIRLNNEQQMVSYDTALDELGERFGNDLISGLVECLSDLDAEVRCMASGLLADARPRSNVAVPFLIERLNDEALIVRSAVITNIADFGPIAVGAIPHLESWLELDNEYMRIMALLAIVRLDPNRTELLPDLREALKSDNPIVRYVARNYFGRANAKMPFDEAAFEETIRLRWNYHSPCEQVHWSSEQQADGTWQIAIAPVFQEMWGGADDGKRVWSGFEVDLIGLSKDAGVEFKDFGAMSQCVDHCPIPFVGIKGDYFGEPFVLRIYLEPIPQSEAKELIDVVRQEVRAIEEVDDE